MWEPKVTKIIASASSDARRDFKVVVRNGVQVKVYKPQQPTEEPCYVPMSATWEPVYSKTYGCSKTEPLGVCE